MAQPEMVRCGEPATDTHGKTDGGKNLRSGQADLGWLPPTLQGVLTANRR